MRKNISGFTIVELIVIITVIGILAAITIVTYNGIQLNSRNATRLAELRGWQKAFQTYKSRNGIYPDVPAGNYCLGSNFPVGYNNENRCRNYTLSDPTISYREVDDAPLMSLLQSVGLPTITGSRNPISSFVGPYVGYGGKNTGGQIYTFFEGGPTSCPKGTTYLWDSGDGVAVLCYLQL